MKLKLIFEVEYTIHNRKDYENKDGSRMSDAEIIEYFKNYEDIVELLIDAEKINFDVMEVKDEN
jgi:hypothetical protein